jgi:hypothetical protein
MRVIDYWMDKGASRLSSGQGCDASGPAEPTDERRDMVCAALSQDELLESGAENPRFSAKSRRIFP